MFAAVQAQIHVHQVIRYEVRYEMVRPDANILTSWHQRERRLSDRFRKTDIAAPGKSRK